MHSISRWGVVRFAIGIILMPVDQIMVNPLPRVGSRRQVFDGKARQTSGGLLKKDLVLSNGKVVSRKKRKRALGLKNNMAKHLVKKIDK